MCRHVWLGGFPSQHGSNLLDLGGGWDLLQEVQAGWVIVSGVLTLICIGCLWETWPPEVAHMAGLYQATVVGCTGKPGAWSTWSCHAADWLGCGDGCRSRGEKGKAGGLEVQARVSSKVMENIRDLPAVLMMDED